jgi:septal ring factor EnvC (AmiA/AmiB activator)
MSLDRLQKRFEDLSQRYHKASGNKAKLEAQLEMKKKELTDLVEEIKAAGFDPKKLKEAVDDAEKELVALMDEYESKLKSVEEALEAYKNR